MNKRQVKSSPPIVNRLSYFLENGLIDRAVPRTNCSFYWSLILLNHCFIMR